MHGTNRSGLKIDIVGGVASGNLDLVRSIYAGLERGDFGSVEWAEPEIAFGLADGPEPGSWTGLAGMAEAIRPILDVWEDWQHEVEEYRELDDERVPVFESFTRRGRMSGLEIRQARAHAARLFHVRRGKMTRLVVYTDRGRALADLRLEPEADSPGS